MAGFSSQNSFFSLRHTGYIYLNTDENRAITRLAKTEAIAEKLDRAAESFFALSQEKGFDPDAERQVKECVLRMYLNTFYLKTLSSSLRTVVRQTRLFSESPWLRRCEDAVPGLPRHLQEDERRIRERRGVLIWMRSRYSRARRAAVRAVKSLLRRRGRA